MDDKLVVQRCVCFKTSFEELVLANVQTLEEIRVRFGCGSKCGSCVPYLKLMLETGNTAFEVIWD